MHARGDEIRLEVERLLLKRYEELMGLAELWAGVCQAEYDRCMIQATRSLTLLALVRQAASDHPRSAIEKPAPHLRPRERPVAPD